MPDITILWGEMPQPGDQPIKYEFRTDAELEAFQDGIDAMDGWMGYEVTDGPNASLRDPWGEHHAFTVWDWQIEVTNNATRQGYWDWVDSQIAMAEEDERIDAERDRPTTLEEYNDWENSSE